MERQMLGAGAIVEQNALRGAQKLIARAMDIGVLDWRSVCAALWRGTPIELVVEEGFERATGFRADLDGAFGAMGPVKANDAETGSKSLLGMAVTLHESVRMPQFRTIAAGNGETKTGLCLVFAANMRITDGHRRAASALPVSLRLLRTAEWP
jgi:hypothetical protein